MTRWWALVLALGAIAAIYFAWPFWSAYSIADAVQRRDAVALSRKVDFETLRVSLKQTIGEQTTVALANKSNADDADKAVSGFASLFAPMIVNGFVEGLVTPQGLANLIGGSEGVNLVCRQCVKSVGFTGPTRFEIALGEAASKDALVIAVLEPSGFDWKLTQLVPLKPLATWPGAAPR